MVFKKIMDKVKNEESEENYVELDLHQNEPEQAGKTYVHVEKIGDMTDVDRIQKKIRNGHIILVKVREIRERDINELKRAVDKLKKTCLALDGDIAGIGDDWVVITPANARVHRESAISGMS